MKKQKLFILISFVVLSLAGCSKIEKDIANILQIKYFRLKINEGDET